MKGKGLALVFLASLFPLGFFSLLFMSDPHGERNKSARSVTAEFTSPSQLRTGATADGTAGRVHDMLLHSYETLTPYSLLLELPALVHNPERSLLHAGLLWSRGTGDV